MKIGDKVRVYGSAGKHPKLADTSLFLRGCLGEVVTNFGNGDLDVKLIDNYPEHVVEVHTKQCRKIKAPKPLRRVWIETDKLSQAYIENGITFPPRMDPEAFTEFVEVRKGKKK